jgi:hypothetical protein
LVRIKNILLDQLLLTAYSKNLLKDPPKAILLNIYIVYAAEKTIEELAKTPNKGNLSKTLIDRYTKAKKCL